MLSLVGTALAGGVSCPKGTKPNGEQIPGEVAEAWCELEISGQIVMHGPYRAWWPNGQLGTVGQYRSGVAVGKWSAWYPSGKLQGHEWFEAGRSVRTKQWSEAGRKLANPPSRSQEPAALVTPNLPSERTAFGVRSTSRYAAG